MPILFLRFRSYIAFFRLRSDLEHFSQYLPLFDFGTNDFPHTEQCFGCCGRTLSASNDLSCGSTQCLNHLQQAEYEII